MKMSFLFRAATAAMLLAALAAGRARAAAIVPAGFYEPNVIIYGKITNNLTTPGTPAYFGNVVFTITPAGGTPFTVTGALRNYAGGAYSYKIQIPAQKVPTGFRQEDSTILAASSTTTATLSASIVGAPATLFSSTGTPYTAGLAYTEVARGKLLQIDLQFNSSYNGNNPDSDGNGLRDTWEIQHFGHIGVDPNADPDGDGDTNLDEFQTSSDPLCYEWTKFLAHYGLTGASGNPQATPFKDGVPNLIQYALGGEPGITPASTIAQRTASSITTISGKRYLTMTIQRPAYRSCHVDYLVETSSDLVNWASTESKNVFTLVNTPTQLQVRDGASLDGSSPAKHRFIRMRVTYKP